MGVSGDRFVLLHGVPLTPEIWAGVAGCLRPFGAVSCPDTTPPAGAADAEAVVAARVAGEVSGSGGRLHVVGHSFGGQVALDLALALPLASLTVLCSRDTPFPEFGATAARIRAGEPVNVPAALGRWFTVAELAEDGPVVRYARHRLETADHSPWAAALEGIARYDRTDVTVSIQAPTTLIAAEFDPVSTPEVMSGLARRIPGARLTVLPGVAHLSQFIDPAALAGRILAAAGVQASSPAERP